MRLKKLFSFMLSFTVIISAPAYSNAVSQVLDKAEQEREALQRQKEESLKSKVHRTNQEYTTEDIQLFNQLLDAENYEGFYHHFDNIVVPEQKKYDFLLSKAHSGHIPTYWLLAESSSILNKKEEAHKWLYTALIMTEQDARKCQDHTATNAVHTLLKSFSLAREFVYLTPEAAKTGIAQAVFFVDNIKQRSNPKWACHYGGHPTNPPLIPKEDFEKQDTIVLDRIKNNFQS